MSQAAQPSGQLAGGAVEEQAASGEEAEGGEEVDDAEARLVDGYHHCAVVLEGERVRKGGGGGENGRGDSEQARTQDGWIAGPDATTRVTQQCGMVTV